MREISRRGRRNSASLAGAEAGYSSAMSPSLRERRFMFSAVDRKAATLHPIACRDRHDQQSAGKHVALKRLPFFLFSRTQTDRPFNRRRGNPNNGGRVRDSGSWKSTGRWIRGRLTVDLTAAASRSIERERERIVT